MLGYSPLSCPGAHEADRHSRYAKHTPRLCQQQRKDMTGLVVGFILGILGSLIAWYMTVGIITPALDIRDNMELIRTAGQPDKYRFAVRNRRIFRDAQDVSIRVRCSYLSHTRGATGGRIRKFFDVPVDDNWIPIIRSRWYWRLHRPEGRTRNDHWAQLPTLCRDEISSSYLNEVPKDNDGLVNIFDILGSDYRGRISVSIIAYDSWSGTKKLFYKRFLQRDLKIVSLHGGNQRSNHESGLGWPSITNTGHRAG